MDAIVTGLIIMIPLSIGVFAYREWRKRHVGGLLKRHFRGIPTQDILVSQREFPYRVRVDLQRAVDQMLTGNVSIDFFCGFQPDIFSECSLAGLLLSRAAPMAPQYEDINIGESEPVRCLRSGLWLLDEQGTKYAVFIAPAFSCGRITGMQVQVACDKQRSAAVSKRFFSQLEAAVQAARSYRGKILSLETPEHYFGESSGILVHVLHKVQRDQVILPKKTVDLLDRNVVQFVRQRPRLTQLRQATKKGLLFYGPPGTGKTHTIHYLMSALEGHTALLITADQVRLLGEYMNLARLLQPSIVVIEDVDLIGRERSRMDTPVEQVLLNKLLNEMDGLTEDAAILFILTTNRPEELEAALSSRPGRIDQAIEFPLPDDEGRAKLIRLYAEGLNLSEDLIQNVLRRTQGVSAAFIKELTRRSVQFHLERNGSDHVQLQDVQSALDEMLFSGGSLNLKLLGAEQASAAVAEA